MWTYNIISTKYVEGNPLVEVNYTDGTHSFNRTYFPNTLDELKRTIQSQLDRCVSNDELLSTISQGLTDLTIPEPEPPVAILPTQDELNEQEYLKKRNILVQAQKDLDLQLITQSEFDSIQADAIAAKQVLKSTPIVLFP